MARTSLLAQSLAKLLEAEGQSDERHVDLCISLRVYETGEELLRVGGKWDRKTKRYTGDAEEVRVLSVHKGQEKAARWLARWMRTKAAEANSLRGAKTTKEREKITKRAWKGFKRAWSAIFLGGRRSGKSRLAVWAVCIFAVCFPRKIAWCVSPTHTETEEIERAIRETLPRSWFRWRGDPNWEFLLPNGTVIKLLSGHKPRALKRGEVHFALYNEGQNMSRSGFTQIRGGTADSGGLTLIAANPPDAAIGFWIEEFYEKAEAGKMAAEAFRLNPKDNPFIVYASLTDMADEMSDEEYRREVLGEMVPIGDMVFHAWNDLLSFANVPKNFIDITAEFTREHLGRSYGHIVGADFQKSPHMVAVVYKVYRDPKDEEKTPIMWVVDEIVVEDADEDDLLDAMEEPIDGARCPCCVEAGRVGYRGWEEDSDHPARPVVCCVIPDASGEWQDSERTKGKGSWDWFRAREWRHLYTPDSKMKKNPIISERCKSANSVLKARTGRRRLYVARHCLQTRRALKHWPNKNRSPDRNHEHAHICDAVTYPIWRFFPRRGKRKGPSEDSIQNITRMTRAGEMGGYA